MGSNGLPCKLDNFMTASTKVKLLRKNCLRVVNMLETDVEVEEVVYIYHYVQNPTLVFQRFPFAVVNYVVLV